MPEEMLIRIFKFILVDDDRDATFNVIFRYPRSRVKTISIVLTLSRVCKFWKATVWAYPAFWTRADGHHKDLLTRILTRAGGLPLSLFVTSNTEGLLELLASYGPRIKRLDMAVCVGAGDVGNLSFVDGKPLECFTLNYECLNAGLQHASPFFLFGERILPLKALSISPFTGHLPSNHFPNLTHLHLVLRVVDDVPPPLSSSFFELLSNTPMLEFLTVAGIGYSLRGLSDKAITLDVPVVLANLRSLVFMHGGLKTVSMVLACLSLPGTALVRLQGVQVPTPEAPPLPQHSVVQSIDRLHIATESTCLQLVAEGPSSGLWLQGRIANKDQADDADEHKHDHGDEDAWSWCGWLSTLPGFIPLAQITKLEVYVGPHHTILSMLLPRMLGVIELSVRLNRDGRQRGGLSLVRLLYQALGETDPLLCPNLRVLGIDVDENCPGVFPELYPEELKRMLIFRSRVGHSIERVVIQPFADAVMVQAGMYHSNRFDALRSVIEVLEVRGPGIPVMSCADDPAWERWSVEGADKYWETELYGKAFYARPWAY
ncbi:hypothetical protein LXA43DRAFT_1100426 [Ganoderma leucocontextum]|nr:hypothetical protein LXA43DRAFT_1100426 [Ganoderma leucocontextum]